jgi:hypothetical protein
MEVQPMIQTPDHSSFPSGHALEAFAIASVLFRLAEYRQNDSAPSDPWIGVEDKRQPFLLAHRIATNRTVAGVHFPVDSLAGAFLGMFVGEVIHHLATGEDLRTGSLKPTVPDNGATPDFLLDELYNCLTIKDGKQAKSVSKSPVKVDKDELVSWFWGKAEAEW